ncbi:thioredoxin family protein [Sulfurimonas sp. MAG313]|nr:thioredoxin family protein [Sulfurimonas sp. MAG313]MDF1880923.1 thioredoxin family protein [Sulfurimonas sp. MAG313]
MDSTLNDLNELNSKLSEEMAMVLYFSSPSCSVCHVLRPKLMQALEKYYPEIGRYHADIALTPEIAAEFQIFSAPSIIVFLEGKEFIRKGRAMSVDGLLQEIKRPYDLMTS